MSRLHKILASSLLVCLASVVWAGEAGEVVYVAGSVAGGVDARTPLAIGAKVAEGDVLKTGADGYVYQGLRTRTSYGFEPKYPDAFFIRPCGSLALHAQAHLAVFSHRDWPHQIQHHLFQ